MMHTIFEVIFGLFVGAVLFFSLKLSLTRHGYVNNHELNVVIAIVMNKLLGGIGIVGCMITIAVWLL